MRALIAFFPTLAVFILAAGTIEFLTRLKNKLTVKDAFGLKEKEKVVKGLQADDREIADKKQALDKRSLTISRIYEAIKGMSGVLKSEEIMTLVSDFLNENFDFRNAHVFLLEGGRGDNYIKKIYKIEKNKAGFIEKNIPEIEKERLALAELAKNRGSSQVITQDRVTVIPLVVEERVTALFMADGLSGENFEDSMILASQLAMEIKKVNLYESVEKLSITDGLTGIYLRRYFTDRLSEEVKRSLRLNLKFSVLMIDIDYFKICNDTYGHMAGDAALCRIAAIIKNNVREIDLAARYGGEEFTLLLPETGMAGAAYVAERIRKAVEDETITAYDERLNLTVSIGVSVFPKDAENPDELVDMADRAMYLSKQRGRNRVTVYE